MNENMKDLWGILWVSPKNKMEGKFTVYGLGEDELNTTFQSRAIDNDSLSVELTVRQQQVKEINSTIDVKYRGNYDINALVQPVVSNSLATMLNIRPYGRMSGIFDILEPARINDILSSIKDSTTRSLEEYKYINYGKSTTMRVGASDSETLTSYLGFDLSEYSNSLIVEKAKLRVYYSGYLLNRDTLELWSADRFWDETGITYANRPLMHELISDKYAINETDKYIEFEVLELVQDIISKKITFEGFILKSNGKENKFDTFFSRESSKPPVLDIVYYDTRVWSTSKSELTATLFSYAVSQHDFRAKLEVKTDWGIEELTATLYVHRYEDPLDYDIDISLGANANEMNTILTVAQTGNSDFSGHLTVRQSIERDYEVGLSVGRPDIDANMFVLYRNEIDGIMTARASANYSISSTLLSSQQELYATLYTPFNDDINAFIVVNQYSDSEVNNSLAINRNEFAIRLHSRALGINEIDSTIFIKGFEREEIDVSLVSSTNELNALLVSKGYAEDSLNIILTSKALEKSEVTSNIVTSSPNIDVGLHVRAIDKSDLYVTMTVQQYDEDNLSLFVYTSNPEINATLQPRISEDFNADLNINNPELRTIIAPRVIGVHNLDVLLYPRVIGASDLSITLSTLNKYRSGAYYYIL